MRSRAGVIQVLLLLLALSVIAASSVSIMAQQKKFGRELSLVNSAPRASTSPASLVKGPCYPVGDVDGDGVLKANDATAILNYVAKIKQPTFYTNRADVNKDGKITAVDAQLIQQYLAGSIKTFPACP